MYKNRHNATKNNIFPTFHTMHLYTSNTSTVKTMVGNVLIIKM